MTNKKPLKLMGFVLLIVIIFAVTGFIILSMMSFIGYRVYTSNPNCTAIHISDENSINIVFLPYNYGSPADFSSDVNRYISFDGKNNGLLSVEPFTSKKDRFNFYRIDKVDDLGCKTEDDVILCDDFKVKRAASQCPHDYIVVLYGYSLADIFKYLRSSAYLGTAAINTFDNRLVIVHEFGHLIAYLADEYVTEDTVLDWDAPNCDVEACPKWIDKYSNVGCFLGCTDNQHYRSMENSIMRDYSKSNSFGPVSEDALVRRIA